MTVIMSYVTNSSDLSKLLLLYQPCYFLKVFLKYIYNKVNNETEGSTENAYLCLILNKKFV